MSKCLVTTLSESSSDTSLLKMGEMKLHFTEVPVVESKRIQIRANADVTLTTKAPSYFTNITGTSNLGTSTTIIGDNTNRYAYVANKECDVIISNKYALVDLNVLQYKDSIAYGLVYCKLDVDDLQGSTSLEGLVGCDGFEGDLSSLKDIKIGSMGINGENPKLTGDLSSINPTYVSGLTIGRAKKLTGNTQTLAQMTNLTVANFYQWSGFEGNLSDISSLPLRTIEFNGTKVKGNLSDVASMTTLRKLNLTNRGSDITGNISSLAGLTNLTNMNLSSTGVVGDTSSLAGLTNLTTFLYANTAITGTWPLT